MQLSSHREKSIIAPLPDTESLLKYDPVYAQEYKICFMFIPVMLASKFQISLKQSAFSKLYNDTEQTACDKPTLLETKQGQPMCVY